MQCHLMNKIGEGGFAVIYKAVTTDSREVAVKVRQMLQYMYKQHYLHAPTTVCNTGSQHKLCICT